MASRGNRETAACNRLRFHGLRYLKRSKRLGNHIRQYGVPVVIEPPDCNNLTRFFLRHTPQRRSGSGKPMRRRYKAVSLFSGAMGLDLGLEQTGRFEIVACVEIESAFCDTIRANQRAGRLSRELQVFKGSVSDIDPFELLEQIGLRPGDVDLLVGGPPCQTFSTAGRRRTVQDVRGSLLSAYLRWIEVLEPRFFLMENVRGLLSGRPQAPPVSLSGPKRVAAPLAPDEAPGLGCPRVCG